MRRGATPAFFKNRHQLEFEGLTVTPYVNQGGRLAYSLRASGFKSPTGPATSRKKEHPES